MDILKAITHVQAAAIANLSGDAASHARLLNEINQLRLLAETPHERTMRQRFQLTQNLCVRLAIEYGVLQYIASKHGESVTATEIAKKTGVDELLIARIMRLVTCVGMCKEVGHATYASDETTKFLVQPGSIGAEKTHTDIGFAVGAKLVDIKRQHGIFQFPTGPDEKTPFEYTYGVPLFQFYDENEEMKEAFDAYMAMRRSTDESQWFDMYPVEQKLSLELKQDNDTALVVDVGGGRGHELTKFQQKFPHIPGKLILQDLPSTITNLPADIGKVETMGIDFFVEQPVKGARIYFMRSVLHDWSNDKCRTILSNIVEAMDPEYSRLLIDEFVLPDTGVDEISASMDFLMMIFNSGVERTERQWDALLKSVNLEIVEVWRQEGKREAVIEARVRRNQPEKIQEGRRAVGSPTELLTKLENHVVTVREVLS